MMIMLLTGFRIYIRKMSTEKQDPLSFLGVVYTWEDIHKVVKTFYQKVEIDTLLKIPFLAVDDWPHHIERLTHFWWIRLGGRPYLDVRYDPVGRHFETGFNEHFLERWLELFHQVLKTHLTQEQADQWYALAQSMGTSLSRNNELMILQARKLKAK